ncbi:SYF2-domain-containing protein [Sporormia fimetaria CBS 119925]|uniref:Pre-mRNA-splicing factor SYF2 n=1 Tax=Sporormia fimetaria CBS 119925 TaxID=1340428 RepID=A0A6A6VCB1_9PLEO|nr:SYF2-domain-containing protein [Sporormia fimetaria CBS 119925]
MTTDTTATRQNPDSAAAAQLCTELSQVAERSKPSQETDPKDALSARMARFKALQAQKDSGKKANDKAARIEEGNKARPAELESKLRHVRDMAEFKLLKDGDPEFERKRAWDYTAEEDEIWKKRVAKKQRNKDNNVFNDYQREANKVYKRQIKQLSQTDLESYAASRAEKLQKQVAAGLLELVETDDGDVYTVDKQGRVNTPVEENYNCDHKPSKEAVDRLVDQLDKSERARLKARAARGLKDDDSGDVTYINHKNKQFNDKLSRFYNKYTAEIRESFERGTAI